MVYEANARMRDPVYGSAGAICQLQKQVNELQAQLAKTQAELVTMQCQHANLMAYVYVEMGQSPPTSPQQSLDKFTNSTTHSTFHNNINFLDENNNYGTLLETLWTWLNRKIYMFLKSEHLLIEADLERKLNWLTFEFLLLNSLHFWIML